LTSLDHSIREGNSVISDPAVQPKAFDRQAAFPELASTAEVEPAAKRETQKEEEFLRWGHPGGCPRLWSWRWWGKTARKPAKRAC
jgi:hypothetical protein